MLSLKYRVTNVIYPTHLRSCADDFLLIHIVFALPAGIHMCSQNGDTFTNISIQRFVILILSPSRVRRQTCSLCRLPKVRISELF